MIELLVVFFVILCLFDAGPKTIVVNRAAYQAFDAYPGLCDREIERREIEAEKRGLQAREWYQLVYVQGVDKTEANLKIYGLT
jgi:hypothetical protein